MADRALVGMAPNEAMANIYLDRFRMAGLPVEGVQPSYPYPHPGAPSELWLMDARLLEDPRVQEQIDQILNPPAEAELAAPEDDEPIESSNQYLKLWLLAIATLTVLPLVWAFIVARTRTPSYESLQSARQVPMDQEQWTYLSKRGLLGRMYVVEDAFESLAKTIGSELAPLGFHNKSRADGFWMIRHNKASGRINEFVLVLPPSDSRDRFTVQPVLVLWAYDPSVGERVGHWLGR